MRPIGVVSKKDIGDLRVQFNIEVWKYLLAFTMDRKATYPNNNISTPIEHRCGMIIPMT